MARGERKIVLTQLSSITKVFEYLSSDPNILDLLEINNRDDESEIRTRILTAKQPSVVADRYKRLAIWEGKPIEQNPRVRTHPLNVDVIVPLHEQLATGIGLKIASAVGSLLDGKPIGRGLHYLGSLSDQTTGSGWYKATARFTYNTVSR